MTKDRKLLILDCFGLFASDPFVTYFTEHYGKESLTLKDEYCEPADLGKISYDEVVENIAKGFEITTEELQKAVYDIAKPDFKMMDWALRQKEKHQVLLLSNCMQGILERIFKDTPFFSCFDGYYLSYELKMVKPYEDIYRKLLSDHEGEYDDCLFIDDNPRNLVAAEKLGMKTLLFTSLEEIDPMVKELGY